MTEQEKARQEEMRKEMAELKKVFGESDHKAVPYYEDAPCYPEEDLKELYWLGMAVQETRDEEKRLELIREFDAKRDSLRRLPDSPERILLWPEGKIPTLTDYTDNSDFRYNHDPDFVPYYYELLVPEDVTPKGAVIFCAGGDHGWALFHEAYQSCRDFVKLGYQTILLANRTNGNPWNAIDAAADCSRAIRLVRMNADRYRISPSKIAFCGFSNGGITGENVIQYFSGEKKMTDYYPGYVPDEADRFYGAQDAYLCVYGPRFVGTGFDFDGVKYPPTFFAIGREDLALDNFNYVYPTLRDLGVPIEIHTFAGVPHGMAGREILDGYVKYPNFQMWVPLADYFLQDLWK